MSVTACPACGSPRLKNYLPSRRTGRSNFRCRGCGLVGWSDRADLVLPDTVGLDEISVAERAAWVASKRDHAAEAAQVEVLDELGARLEGGPQGRLLYDIGTGDGQFLAVASTRGYQVRGNDLMEANVVLAAQSHHVEVDLGDLSVLDVPAQDAVTMWCVLAHVADPEALLQSSFDLLKPGGTLFLQTPRRSKVDSAALRVSAAARGRMSRWVDRRIAPHHWHLHTAQSMSAALRAVGFVDVEVIPRARYSLNSGAYLASLGVPPRAAGAVGRTTDRLIDRGWAPRIVLEAYARKPGTLAAPAAGVGGEYDGDGHAAREQRRTDLDRHELARSLGIEVATMMAGRGERAAFLVRLERAYGRARGRTGAGAWTLGQPGWWVDTATVARRRSLPDALADRWLSHRRRA